MFVIFRWNSCGLPKVIIAISNVTPVVYSYTGICTDAATSQLYTGTNGATPKRVLQLNALQIVKLGPILLQIGEF